MIRSYLLLYFGFCAIACAGTAAGDTGSEPKMKARAAPQEATQPSSEPEQLNLTVGAPHVVRGVQITVTDVSHAHLKNDENLSMCRLEASFAGKTEELSLSRVHSEVVKFEKVFSIEIGLEHADGYHQPGSAQLIVR